MIILLDRHFGFVMLGLFIGIRICFELFDEIGAGRMDVKPSLLEEFPYAIDSRFYIFRYVSDIQSGLPRFFIPIGLGRIRIDALRPQAADMLDDLGRSLIRLEELLGDPIMPVLVFLNEMR